MLWLLFEGRAIPALSEKLPKWHFLTRTWNLNFWGPNYFIWSGMKVPFPDSVMNWPINWLISTHSEERKKEYKLNNPPDLSAYPVENCIPKHAFKVEHVENRKKSNFTFLMHQNYSLNIMSVYGMSICFRHRALSYGSKIILDHLNHFGLSKSFWSSTLRCQI